MSEEMAVSDNATGEDAKEQSIDTALEDAVEAMDGPSEQPAEETPQEPEESKQAEESNPDTTKQPNPIKNKIEIDIKKETDQLETKQDNEDIIKDEFEVTEHKIEGYLEDDKKGMKRRASEAFSDDDVEFKGFEDVKQEAVVDDYNQVLERLEAEVSAASKMFTPVRHVMATPAAPVRASKRPRKDTGMSDGSRPSSAQSSRSEDDNPSMSPAGRGRGRVDPQSPLLRVPLARGWRRELVYRAALDAHSRRNADIYYYTPHGKKLRSTREVAEHLSGTGLTLENFSFFKEPLGVDDPEKEIIRDAKLMRRLESPVSSPAPLAVDGKRTPKPKQPKGASPEPTPKSPPSRLKVKSVGSRVSTPAPAPKQQKKAPPPAPTATPTATPQATPTATPAPTTNDNNNSAAWKKPRAPPPGPAPPPAPAAPPPAPPPPAGGPEPPARPQPDLSSPDTPRSRLALQPCSLSCGGGVPSLSCGACLCLYHPVCAGHPPHLSTDNFLCKNCRKPSPERSPPAPAPRRLSTTSSGGSETRVLLRMKVSAGGAGERVWAVAGARAPPPAPRAPPPAPRPPPLARSLPQSLASINGRRFIVVPRPAPLPTNPAPQ